MEIALSKERMKHWKSSLTSNEETLYRSIAGQLNWVAGISQPDTSYAVCESSTKLTHAIAADIIYVTIRNRFEKSSLSTILELIKNKESCMFNYWS